MDVNGFLTRKKKKIFKASILLKKNVRSHFMYKTGATAGIPLGKNVKVMKNNDGVGICF